MFTITATAERAGLNPLAYLTAYLQERARAGATTPTGEALTRFLPWAASTDDLTAWVNTPHPNPTPQATTPVPRTSRAPGRPHNRLPLGAVHHHKPTRPQTMSTRTNYPPMAIGGPSCCPGPAPTHTRPMPCRLLSVEAEPPGAETEVRRKAIEDELRRLEGLDRQSR